MGAIGDCCCCCGPLDAPATIKLNSPASETKLAADFTSDPCCKTVTLYPSSTAFIYACSAAARTQQIDESYDYKVYLRELQVVTGSTAPRIDCVINKDGSQTCTTVDSEGNPIVCDESQTLCTTLTQVASQTRTLHAAGKYRVTKTEVTLYRVDTTCGAETTPTCKYVLVARMFVQLFYGNIIKQYLSRVTSGATSCCILSVDYNELIDESCRDAIDRTGLTEVNLVLTRSKVFTSMPTGIVTLTEADEIDCADTLDGCVSPVGDQSISITTSNVGIWSTVPASCNNTENSIVCAGLYDFGGLECFRFVISTVTRTIGVVSANLLASLHLSVQYVCNPTEDIDTNPDTINCDQKQLWDLICDNLSSVVSDTGYTARTLKILDGDWTLELPA